MTANEDGPRPAPSDEDGWSLGELVAAGDGAVNARTVRFWIKEGLLPAPSGGRGTHARYGRRHLERIAEIRRLQSLGLSLTNIGLLLGAVTAPVAPPVGPSAEPPVAPGEAAGVPFWTRRPMAPEQSLPLGPGLRLVVDTGAVGTLDAQQQAELIRSAGPLLATLAALVAAPNASRKV